MNTRRCLNCGADLTGRRRQCRYCSGACRAEASRKRAGTKRTSIPTLARESAQNRTDRGRRAA